MPSFRQILSNLKIPHESVDTVVINNLPESDTSSLISFKEFLTEEYLLEVLSKSTSNMVSRVKDSLTKRIESENLDPHPSGDSLGHLRDMLDNRPDHHATWALSRYNRGHIGRIEDIPPVLDQLRTFDGMVERGETDKKALSKLGTPMDLASHITARSSETSQGSLRRISRNTSLDPKEYSVTHENKHFSVVVPHTKEAAVHFGCNSSWCTSSLGDHNRFEQYNRQGPLHILIPKNPSHSRERYQFHLKTGQFMNEKDESVGMKSVFKDRSAPTGSIFHTLHKMHVGSKEEQEKVFRGTKDESLKDYFVQLHPHLKLIDLDINHPRNHEKFAVHGTPEQKMYLAAAPYLSSETQIILSKQQELIGKIGKLLLNRPDLHPDAQFSLAAQGGHDIHTALVGRPDLDLYVQRQLAIRGDHDIHTALVGRPDLHPSAHYPLAKHGDHDIHTALMGRPDLHPGAQYSLAIRGDHDIRTALVGRPDLHPDAHYQLAMHGDHDIHTALVGRPDLHPDARKMILDRQSKRKV